MLNSIYYSIDPIAFFIGPWPVRWYGLAYLLGFVCAAVVIWRVARRWRVPLDVDALASIMLCVVIGVLVGGRLGYILFYGKGFYFAHPEEILAFNHGGMSFHGGLVGAVVAGWIAAKLNHIPFLTLADLACIGAPLGLLFGRCANFINGELWGAPTDAAWGVVFGGAAGMMPRHPSQLYEAALEGVVIFVVLYALARRHPPFPRATFLALFLILYSVFRFLVEFVREPDVQLGYLWGGWLTMGQLLSIPLFIAGVGVFIYALVVHRPQAECCCAKNANVGAKTGRDESVHTEDTRKS